MTKNKSSYFSLSIFLPTLVVIVFINAFNINIFKDFIHFESFPLKQAIINALYWILISGIITVLIRFNSIKLYEKPMKKFAKATNKVSLGDFTVYVEPIHSPEKYDYLDFMILDFNKMVEELGSVETLKTDFLSNVSHEIKTPLAIIQNYAELLKDDYLSFEKQSEYSQIIYDSTRRLSNLITNILKINKLEKQRIDCHYERYDVCEQVCNCILAYEDLWEKKNLELDVELEEKRYVDLDQELLELVWNNLLSNAIKFSEENGKIRIRQYVAEDSCIVEISDCGCGMSEKTMKHIFDKFYQGDTSHAIQGNGLGLALVSKILPLLNGSISVRSTIGKGSTFTINLPLSSSENEDRTLI